MVNLTATNTYVVYLDTQVHIQKRCRSIPSYITALPTFQPSIRASLDCKLFIRNLSLILKMIACQPLFTFFQKLNDVHSAQVARQKITNDSTYTKCNWLTKYSLGLMASHSKRK